MTDKQKYLIWSLEHNAWWKPVGPTSWGYTTDINYAGLYSREEAEQICFGANYDMADEGKPMEAMVPTRRKF